MIIWMKVSNDKYEFPLDIADSASELARKHGISVNSIYAGAFRYEENGLHSPWRRVQVEDDEEEAKIKAWERKHKKKWRGT